MARRSGTPRRIEAKFLIAAVGTLVYRLQVMRLEAVSRVASISRGSEGISGLRKLPSDGTYNVAQGPGEDASPPRL